MPVTVLVAIRGPSPLLAVAQIFPRSIAEDSKRKAREHKKALAEAEEAALTSRQTEKARRELLVTLRTALSYHPYQHM